MRCDCSICERKGIVMTQFVVPSSDLLIEDDGNLLRTYRFGTQTAKHHFCSQCGSHLFVETRLDPGHFRINLGCVDGVSSRQLPIEVYDGKSLAV